jgi:peptidase E
MLRRLLLISTSTVHGSGYLDYCADDIVAFLRDRLRVLFIPFARPSGIDLADYSKRVPYIGTSAGSNVAGLTIGTANDMPIVHPPTLDAFGLVPFNINPHYLDPDPDSKHKGETRETRIKEFHVLNAQPVVGLREGAWLEISGDSMLLGGSSGARLFRSGSEPEEFKTGDGLDFLLSSSR